VRGVKSIPAGLEASRRSCAARRKMARKFIEQCVSNLTKGFQPFNRLLLRNTQGFPTQSHLHVVVAPHSHTQRFAMCL